MASFRGILNIQSLNEFTPRNGVYRKLERADRLSVRQTEVLVHGHTLC